MGTTHINRCGAEACLNCIEINLVEDALGAGLFANVRTVETSTQVSMLAGDRMKEKKNTLIFLDEIQAYPTCSPCLKFSGSQDGQFTYRLPCWASAARQIPPFPWAASERSRCSPGF